jgi:phage host-nuclease inhibitor protein Gam
MAKKLEQTTTLKDWQEVDETLRNIGILNSKLDQLTGEMNQRITEVQSKFQKTIDELNSEKIGLESNLKLYVESRRDEFSEKKSKELNWGIVSFRLSNPAVKTLKGFTWESVKLVIAKSKKYTEMFLKIKTDIDKNAILASGLSSQELAKLGVERSQTENFAYECFNRK